MINQRYLAVGFFMLLIIGGTVARAQHVSRAEIQHDALQDIVQAFENHAIAKGFFPQEYDLQNLIEEGFLSADSYVHDYGFYLEEMDGTYLVSEEATEEFPVHLVMCEDRVAAWTFSEEQKSTEEALAWWHEHGCPQPKYLNYMHISAGDLLLLLPGDDAGEEVDADNATQETEDAAAVVGEEVDHDEGIAELNQVNEKEYFKERSL